MSNTIFWKPNSSKSQSNGSINLNNKTVNKLPNKKFLKGLGITGGVALGVVGILGLILFIFVIRPGLVMLNSARVIKNDLNEFQVHLKDRDAVKMNESLAKVEADLNSLRDSRDSTFGWARNFGPTKNYYSDSEHFITAGLILIDATKDTVKLIEPFSEATGLSTVTEEDESEDPSDTGLAEAFSSWISLMPQVAGQMDPVIAKLDKAGEELKPVDANRYPVSIRGFLIRDNIVIAQNTLSQVSEYGPDIKKALTIIPGLLGVDTGTKRYMIIMQNDKELRATGGFWTNYATFKVNNAMLDSDFSSKDMYSIDITLDAIDAYTTFPKVPVSYNQHLKVERMYARDANISPDYPTAIDQFMWFYDKAIPLNPGEIKPVDGIVAIDTEVIRELMDITGPVTVNGVTYTSENVVLELERIASLELREQVGRKKVLGDLMEEMLINVYNSDKNLWPKLVEKGVDLMARKHILFYSFDPEAQALAEEYNVAGRIQDPVEGDFSYVVSTNLGGDKTNWFVKKSVDHVLTKENNRWVNTVTINYNYPQPEDKYGPFIKLFKDWIRVYAPLNSELIGVEGSLDESTTDQERNKTYFTGWIEVAPGETKSVTFKYYLPDGVVTGDMYRLYIEKQPGTNGEVHNVTVNGKTQNYELTKDVKISQRL